MNSSKYWIFSYNNHDYYLGNISTTENDKLTLEKEKSMTSLDRNSPTNDQTSSSVTEEKLDHDNKSDDNNDESLDELDDEEEMRVCL